MDFNIKIVSTANIAPKTRCDIVSKYCEMYSQRIETMNNFSKLFDTSFTLKETGKYPEKISIGSYEFWIHCKKSGKSFVFNIWRA
jgi:hypothetical protein